MYTYFSTGKVEKLRSLTMHFCHFITFMNSSWKGLIDTWSVYLPISYAWLLSLLRIRIARSVKKQCRDKQAPYSMVFWGHTLFFFLLFYWKSKPELKKPKSQQILKNLRCSEKQSYQTQPYEIS